MTDMQSYEPGMFCWIELTTADGEAAKRFYTSLFGWETNGSPLPDGSVYEMLFKDGKNVGAMYENKKVPTGWQSYVAVASVDESTERAGELGGSVVAPPFDVMEHGRMAVIADPQGAKIALWEGRGHKGAQVRDETGSLCWTELMTSDVAAARDFYKGLFGWNLKVSEEYSEIHLGERAIGGMMQHPMPGAPPAWTPYIMVESVDSTVEQATAKGANVFVKNDIPNVGRFAYLGDPQQAVFAIYEPLRRA